MHVRLNSEGDFRTGFTEGFISFWTLQDAHKYASLCIDPGQLDEMSVKEIIQGENKSIIVSCWVIIARFWETVKHSHQRNDPEMFILPTQELESQNHIQQSHHTPGGIPHPETDPQHVSNLRLLDKWKLMTE